MRSRTAGLVALVATAALAVFLGSLPNEFVYDDHELIRMNSSVRDPARVGSFFAGDLFHGTSNYFRPLPGLVFTAVYRLAGPTPWAFRLVNLALHLLASVLVFRLLDELLRERPAAEQAHRTAAALAGALLFTVHPVHVEAVAWISGVMDVACAAFALLAFDCYRHADTSRRGRLRLTAGLVAFLLALLAKETAVVLPVLLGLYEGLAPAPRRLALRPALRRLLPWLLTLGVYVGLRAAALGSLVAHGRPGGSPLVAADLLARYFRALFLPLELSIGHFVPAPDSWASPRGLFALAVLLALAALAWAGWRFHRGVLFALAFVVLTLGPALALAGLGPRLSKLFSERYLYLPSAGWALGVGLALALAASRAGRRHRLVWLAAAAAGLALAATTVRQNRVWRTELTLWTDAVRKFPADGMNHLDLGRALLAAGDADAARRAFDRATAVDPGLVDFHLQQGRGFLQAGLPLRALLAFDSAMALAPDSFEALLGAADASNAAGWHDLAARRYLAALARRPDSSAARNGFGYLLARAGRLDEAIVQFELAAAAAPGDPTPLRNLATVWERRGDAARAAELRARADALAPR